MVDHKILILELVDYKILILGQWPNLKNLSGGLNLNRGLNMVGST